MKENELQRFMLKPKPYKLKNAIQHYEWGTKGKNAFIPKLLNIKAEHNKPYAELWIGAHPKASSKIVVDGKEIDLLKAIQKYPIETLGEKTAKRFSNTLPFLFKVLSANEALSIQVHPSKRQAIALRKKDPINYPDSNQKHEIAIALDSLTALMGFKPAEQILKTLNDYPEIKEFVGGSTNHLESNIKSLIKKSKTNREDLRQTLIKINERIRRQRNRNEIEKYFVTLYKKYGVDVGLLLLFFLNLVHLKKWQAIFTKPGVPHAYLKGNILECMSNSDNVIRAGLTSKFKDIDSLLKVLKYDFNPPQIIKAEERKNASIYQTDAEEFELKLFTLSKNDTVVEKSFGPRIVLALKGELRIAYLDKEKLKSVMVLKGESVFLPAHLAYCTIYSLASAKFVLVTVPTN